MRTSIPVYRAEREAGLEERIRSSGSIAYASVAVPGEPGEATQLSRRALARVSGRVKAGSEGQPDLHPLKTLLVSTGVNKNDDAFDRIETWLARNSPEDKPFNYEHQGDDIIGHITACHVVDGEQKVVADDTALDDVPAKFHIVTAAVLYKVWEDEALQERMDTILEEIAKGEWFVSMEALFKGFDYLLVATSAKGAEAKVVARNKETAFLTKHLRAYGGSGTYQKYRVCRLLRNITFSGKGLVRKPANPESVIFTDTEDIAAAAGEMYASVAGLGYSTATNQRIPQESETMAAENDARVGELTAENKTLRAQVEQLQTSLKDNDQKVVKAQVDSLTTEIATLRSRLEAAEQKATAAADEAGAWKKKLEETQEQARVAAEELAKAKEKEAKAARVSLLVGSLEMEEAEAAEMAEKLAYLKDDEFKAHADYLSERMAAFKQAGQGGGKKGGDKAATSTGTTKPKTPPQATDKTAPMKGHSKKIKTLAAEDDDADADADPAVLDGAEPDKQPALATAPGDDGVEKVRASISDYLADYFDLPPDADAGDK